MPASKYRSEAERKKAKERKSAEILKGGRPISERQLTAEILKQVKEGKIFLRVVKK